MYQIILSAHIAIINTLQWYVDENLLAGYLAFLFASIAVYSAISKVHKRMFKEEKGNS
ncbi:MAG: hypothetical protein V1779_00145 [bacterium]